MRSNARRKLDNLYEKIEGANRAYQSRKSAKKRLKFIGGGYDCKQEYKDKVVPFWSKYNYKPKKYWYNLYSADSKKVDPRYIPDDLWFSKVVPYFSNMQFRRGSEDKCMHEYLFPNLKSPKTFIMNIASLYYDNKYNLITKEEAINICLNKDKFIIKPSIDSGEGRLISFIDLKNNNKKEIEKRFELSKSNFIIQEIVNQHPVLAELNLKSLNTIRVVSFLFEGKVHILSSILRIGGSDSKVDNVGLGGYGCKINSDGRLNKYAVNKNSEWISELPNGKKISNVIVPSYEEVIDIIKKEHIKLAHFKIIGWDFGIDIKGDPIFIEFNVCPGQNQITCGPTFGNLTEAVLEDLFLNKSLEYSQN